MPLAEAFNSTSYTDETLKVVGWGRTENGKNITLDNERRQEIHYEIDMCIFCIGTPSNFKLHANVAGYDFVNCSDKYRSSNKIVLRQSQLCALGNGTDTCNGDSGGPILTWATDPTNPRRTYWYAAGITSFGTRDCARPGFPAIYTRVSHFKSWIISKLKP